VIADVTKADEVGPLHRLARYSGKVINIVCRTTYSGDCDMMLYMTAKPASAGFSLSGGSGGRSRRAPDASKTALASAAATGRIELSPASNRCNCPQPWRTGVR
jgi:hypothetical protein